MPAWRWPLSSAEPVWPDEPGQFGTVRRSPDRITIEHRSDPSRSRIYANWLPPGQTVPTPHLPSYPGYVQLGVAEFTLRHDQQGELRYRVAVYQHLRFKQALEQAGVKLDRIGSHPACEFVLMPPLNHDGRFGMDYRTSREVEIVQPFLIQRTQLVQAVWNDVMGTDPALFKGPLNPVEQVSWNDCMEFARRVGLQLPSEAQWEFACRGGSHATYTYGNDPVRLSEFAWFSDNAKNQTHPVAKKQANAFGLYDMHGNVWEWCRDPFHHTENGPTDGRAYGEPQPGDEDAYRHQPHQIANENHVPHRQDTGSDSEQGSDPTARPAASSGAAAGAAARPSAARRPASGSRPASATASSGSVVSASRWGDGPRSRGIPAIGIRCICPNT